MVTALGGVGGVGGDGRGSGGGDHANDDDGTEVFCTLTMVAKTMLNIDDGMHGESRIGKHHAGNNCIVVLILPSMKSSRRDSYDLPANEPRAEELLGRREGTPCRSPKDSNTSTPVELPPALFQTMADETILRPKPKPGILEALQTSSAQPRTLHV